MPLPPLSRPALARVLRSLLTAELRAARGRTGAATVPAPEPASEARHGVAAGPGWGDGMPIGPGGLGCDSLEGLSLAAAANEMFHLHEAEVESDLLSSPTFGGWLDTIEAAWRVEVGRFTFTTSGSTGRPKRCVQNLAHLRTEVDALAARWTGRSRILALAPAHHIYGFLFAALLPDRLGIPAVDASAWGPAALAAALRPGDLVVSFPERWSFVERSVADWPADVEGVVSTAPCPTHVLAGLAERGLGRMTEVYGSSETAGIAWRDDPGSPYELMPQWRFARGPDGEQPILVHDDGTSHAMMDDVVRHGQRRFRLAGRRDGMVQVGGVNVSPAAVAERLRGRPGVRWAAVRLMGPGQGARLKAFLLPEPGVDGASLAESVDRWAAGHLTSAERPTVITVGDAAVAELPTKSFDW